MIGFTHKFQNALVSSDYPVSSDPPVSFNVPIYTTFLYSLTFRRPKDNSGLERMMAEKNQGTQAFVAISTFAEIPVSTVRKELDPDDVQLALEIAGCFLGDRIMPRNLRLP